MTFGILAGVLASPLITAALPATRQAGRHLARTIHTWRKTVTTARARLLAYLQQAGLSTARAEANLNAYTHELAEQQREHFGVGDAPVRAHCDPDCDFCRGVIGAANLIDPEAQR